MYMYVRIYEWLCYRFNMNIHDENELSDEEEAITATACKCVYV